MIGYLLMGLVPSIFIFFGLYQLISYIRLKKKCTEEVDGVVVDTVVSTNSEGGNVYYPVFQYNYEGSDYTLRSRISSNKLKEGAHVRIFVDPEEPERYYCAETAKTTLRVVILALVLGVGMILFQVVRGILIK